MRRGALLIGVVFMLLDASASHAIEASFVGVPETITVRPGDLVTLDMALDNVSRTPTVGLIIELRGWFGVAEVISGVAANSGPGFVGAPVHFAEPGTCTPTGCASGLGSVNNPFYGPNDLTAQIQVQPPGLFRVFVALVGFGVAPVRGDGSLDPGLAGEFGSGGIGAVDATLTLRIATQVQGLYTLRLDGEYSDGSDVLRIQSGDSIVLHVIPEPGTALLIGAGLVALCASRSPRGRTI